MSNVIETSRNYWGEKGRYQDEYNRLQDELIPREGEAETTHGEVLRAMSRIYYEAFNNGNINWEPEYLTRDELADWDDDDDDGYQNEYEEETYPNPDYEKCYYRPLWEKVNMFLIDRNRMEPDLRNDLIHIYNMGNDLDYREIKQSQEYMLNENVYDRVLNVVIEEILEIESETLVNN